MNDAYDILRIVHITAVVASGLLFVARGLGVNVFLAAWPMRAPVRYASYSIDTVPLAAAILLAWTTRQYPFADAWLTAKVLALVAYILLGTFALRRGRTRQARTAFMIGAVLLFLFIVSVARTRDPLGVFSGAPLF